MRVLAPSGDEFAPSGDGSGGGTVVPYGAILGASGGNGIGGAAGATSLKKSPSHYVCGDPEKKSSSLISSSEMGAPSGGG